MTIDEAIKRIEEVVEEDQRVIDTGNVFDDETIDMLYRDDTEFIEECLENYRRNANENRQLVEWLKDYKRLLEQEPILDKIRAEITDWQTDIHDNEYDAEEHDFVFERIFEIIDKYKAEMGGGE